MEIALVIAVFTIGATVGAMVMYAAMSDDRPIIDQFNDMHHTPDSLEARARRAQS